MTLFDGRRRTLATRPDIGVAAWNSCAGGAAMGSAARPARDDAWSLTTDWPLDAPVEVLGQPSCAGDGHRRSAGGVPLGQARTTCGPTAPRRWSRVALLNLTHRVRPPALLIPGEPYEIEVELEATSWVFPAGHSIRLSIAGNDWPNTWVPPQPVTLTVESVQLQLPVLPPGGAGAPQFAPLAPPAADTTSADVERRPRRAARV